jgi:uncharacterized protein (DUF427 family)
MEPARIEPGPGQESVWDYPRPPALVSSDEHVVVEHAGVTVADSRRAVRILETSQPPAYYLPPDDVDLDLFVASTTRTFCEWKGTAEYRTLRVGDVEVVDAAWLYPRPTPRYETIAGHLAFYAQRLDGCWVDDERVDPNEGSFYGGWITSKVVGPFKGAPGTSHW